MRWFQSILTHKADDLIPPEGMDTDQQKQWRISLLTQDEYKAFEWFRKGYTAGWTAETMLLDKKTAKRLFDSVYRKLSVTDETCVSRVYRSVKLTPEELPSEEDGY